LLVKFRATTGQLRIFARRLFKHLRGGDAVAPPVGQELAPKILDGVNLIIRHDDLAHDRRGGDTAKVERKRQHRLLIVDGARHPRVVGVR
jgi:hypothetical protein